MKNQLRSIGRALDRLAFGVSYLTARDQADQADRNYRAALRAKPPRQDTLAEAVRSSIGDASAKVESELVQLYVRRKKLNAEIAELEAIRDALRPATLKIDMSRQDARRETWDKMKDRLQSGAIVGLDPAKPGSDRSALVVTRGGKIMEDQAEGIRLFKEACLRGEVRDAGTGKPINCPMMECWQGECSQPDDCQAGVKTVLDDITMKPAGDGALRYERTTPLPQAGGTKHAGE